MTKLKKMNVSNPSKVVKDILGWEQDGTQWEGLVDCPADTFEKEYKHLAEQWPAKFTTYMESTKMRLDL